MEFPPINELQAFDRVARLLSFKRASDELNLAPSTLSHLVRSLEGRLKTRLFNRTTRSVALTEAGQKFHADLGRILENLDQLITQIERDETSPSGTVRLSVNETSAPIVLQRLDADFYARFPDISVELNVDNRLVDIVAEGFDAGVRLRDDIPKDMIAVPMIKDFRFVMVAAPAYVEKYGMPEIPEDLAKHNCIGFRFQSNRRYVWEFAKGNKETSIDVSGSLTTNAPRILVDAALDGIGIANVAEPLVKDAISQNRLVRVLDGWERDWPGLYLYYPMNRHMPPALRACINALREPSGKTS